MHFKTQNIQNYLHFISYKNTFLKKKKTFLKKPLTISSNY
jgi:hypothetical protein